MIIYDHDLEREFVDEIFFKTDEFAIATKRTVRTHFLFWIEFSTHLDIDFQSRTESLGCKMK